MTKIVKLKTVKPAKRGKAVPGDVRMIHQVLSDLESGMIEEIAVVGLNKDGTMMRGWSKPRRTGNAFRMIGCMEVLREEYLRTQVED